MRIARALGAETRVRAPARMAACTLATSSRRRRQPGADGPHRLIGDDSVGRRAPHRATTPPVAGARPSSVSPALRSPAVSPTHTMATSPARCAAAALRARCCRARHARRAARNGRRSPPLRPRQPASRRRRRLCRRRSAATWQSWPPSRMLDPLTAQAICASSVAGGQIITSTAAVGSGRAHRAPPAPRRAALRGRSSSSCRRPAAGRRAAPDFSAVIAVSPPSSSPHHEMSSMLSIGGAAWRRAGTANLQSRSGCASYHATSQATRGFRGPLTRRRARRLRLPAFARPLSQRNDLHNARRSATRLHWMDCQAALCASRAELRHLGRG